MLLSFGLLDLLRFAFIQRGSLVFWMHIRPNDIGGIAADGSKIIR
jgi:hypothetical protein